MHVPVWRGVIPSTQNVASVGDAVEFCVFSKVAIYLKSERAPTSISLINLSIYLSIDRSIDWYNIYPWSSDSSFDRASDWKARRNIDTDSGPRCGNFQCRLSYGVRTAPVCMQPQASTSGYTANWDHCRLVFLGELHRLTRNLSVQRQKDTSKARIKLSRHSRIETIADDRIFFDGNSWPKIWVYSARRIQ